MFSLIIAIISIALVAVLALATVYYGGAAFNQGATKAAASRLINEGQQVSSGVKMLETNRSQGVTDAITTVTGLAPSYLTAIPADYAGSTAIDQTTLAGTGPFFAVTAATVPAAVCAQVNVNAGNTGTVAAGSSLFGCDTSTDASAGKVWYNF